ncbi:hypothetical protein HPP92_015813 [Vanilla planifolia]|uniref:Uncharacterized protein n=1 Tax=Vanilla planifolia TaxID=51239 RepID=A0A835QN11_VANPL|nr:hypothetical protein HPP92_015813 [Vanilla planifolia]
MVDKYNSVVTLWRRVDPSYEPQILDEIITYTFGNLCTSTYFNKKSIELIVHSLHTIRVVLELGKGDEGLNANDWYGNGLTVALVEDPCFVITSFE